MADAHTDRTITRRDFLRITTAVSGAVAFSPFLESCARPLLAADATTSPTSTRIDPTQTEEPMPSTNTPQDTLEPAATGSAPAEILTEPAGGNTARIALVKTKDRSEGVRKAIELLGVNSVEGKTVFLKPNFNSSDPTPGSTHPDVLKALVTKLQELGAQQITIGDRSGMGDTRLVMEKIGVFDLADKLGCKVLVLDELDAQDWTMIQPSASHWEIGFPFARPCLEAQAVVQTCCLKTHRYGGHFTMSLKNSVGLVAARIPKTDHEFMSELHSSAHQRKMIAEINTAYSPALIVLDAVQAFISGGPDQGKRVSPEIVLAGTDRIAMDATGVALLRFFGCQTEVAKGKIFEQEQIARAVELGLGIDSPEKIEFLTGDAESSAFAETVEEVLRAG